MKSSRKTKQVIVTGATGFVGRHLVPLLLSADHEVVAIARDPEKARRHEWFKDVKFIQADIYESDFNFAPEVGAGLVHLAWGGLSNYESPSHLELNLPGSCTTIRALIEKGVAQVLVTGTCLEYGLVNGPISSRTPANPINSYALAKDKLRQYLRALQVEEKFILQWARLFYMYGEGQNSKSILAQLDAAIDRGDAIFNMSGGEQLRDYLSVNDVAIQICRIYRQKTDGNFNVCSGKPISIRQLVEARIKNRKARIKLNLGYYPYLDYEPMAFWGMSEGKDS